ncbi:M20 family metallo-hydrolase [Novacetimonas hansenii]|uniref:M20 family metallo-hydrolase n=1 Tax=Novacetimonas hansenii TaxID=436 RepID=A0AAW5ET07_NOVHA|nr:M20 family metallo-hydrolase [Novacetimonas hansenii]MCJ8354306.1 M20 family metallo-hydrolase [Novacetimonas hansenii]PYD71960.1 Zn-dependent hydrolase [Novacetimonas hansenii]RFP05333.1 Zn-dependent hydrolase [Novacetimonas hansenii]WEQ59841.1 M20 family metallo-hydrolase [Novacetimonas hansenii]CUW47932.1 Putative hydrolase/MSMEI_3903 [Novacetimonas hansenii]
MHKNANITIDGPRLNEDIAFTSRFGATPRGGIRRLALSAEDRLVRDWLATHGEALGCSITIDTMGSQFLRLEGSDPTLPPLMMGSHLDTQPTGGRYDGIYGVLGGLAVLRAFRAAGYVPRHSIELANWTNEEGARFAPAMTASGVFAGVFTLEQAYALADRDGVRLGDALQAIGYRGDEPCGAHPLAAYFELHIEQGPVLENEGKTIGVVTGVQGMRWFDVTLTGQEAHAGTTPMELRRDALLAAARLMVLAADVAAAHGPDAKTTIGIIDARPGSRNVVPGEVRMTLDLRHPEDAVIDRMEADFRARADEIACGAGIDLLIEESWASPSVPFDPACIGIVRDAAAKAGLSHRDIISGAGHDAAYMARICPTAMIFIPCRDGLSHNEAEYAEPEDIVAGANVLMRAIMAADEHFDPA